MNVLTEKNVIRRRSMTPKQNLLAALGHREPAWIPWTPLLGGVNTPCFVPSDMKARGDALKIGLYLQAELGCDVFDSSCVMRGNYQTAKVREKREGDVIVSETEILGRTLRTVVREFPYGDQVTSAIAEYPIKSLDDIHTMEALLQDFSFKLETEEWKRKYVQLGEQGVMAGGAHATPIMGLILLKMGLENFINLQCDHPRELHRLMDRIHEANLKAYSEAAESECEVIYSAEDVSTLLISPDMFRQYVLPTMKEYADICHGAGKLFVVHTCAHILDFLPMFLETGIDALHYLTQPPLGNTPLKKARQAWGDRITIMGSVAPAKLESASAAEIAEETRSMLADVGSDRSFVLMTSSKPQVREENLRAIAEIMKQQKGE